MRVHIYILGKLIVSMNAHTRRKALTNRFSPIMMRITYIVEVIL